MSFWNGVLSARTDLDCPILTAELGLAQGTAELLQVYLFGDVVSFAQRQQFLCISGFGMEFCHLCSCFAYVRTSYKVRVRVLVAQMTTQTCISLTEDATGRNTLSCFPQNILLASCGLKLR